MASTSQTPPNQTGCQMDMNPRAINVGAFAVARANEINTMMHTSSTTGSVQRTFQRLPRHMQRRAMSHNIKRMPRRLREVAKLGAEKNPSQKPNPNPAGPNKKSRRHRRRPGNLREEYAKRQMKKRWLETHIWHAKRFKMVECWGWKIPLHPSDKSARAAYRATARHCVMSDISYHQVIQVQGSEVNILSAMKHMTSPLIGLTMASKAYLQGTRHGEVLLYHKDTYPLGAIGLVDYLWQCGSSPSTPAEAEKQDSRSMEKDVNRGDAETRNERRLWIWVHPSCWQEVLNELNGLSSDYNVTVSPLEDELLRFRLQGPLAHPILLDALQVAMITPHDARQDEQGGESDTSYWWDGYYKDTTHLETFKRQVETWTELQQVQSTSEVPTNAVMSLVVRDPRIVLPKKRKKVMVDPENLAEEPSNQRAHKLPHEASISPLWSPKVRQSVATEQRPNHELNQLRSKLLVPGTDLNLGRAESRIPILLLHRPGTRSSGGNQGHESTGMLGYGGGWDLVVPRKWGMPFWVGLVYRGARAVGLREAGKVALHRSLPRLPYDFPDSKAGRDIEKSIADDLEETFMKKPPAKRMNHAKLGIASPFCPPWTQLISEWVRKETGDHFSGSEEVAPGSSSLEDWYVLRNKEKIGALRTIMQEWSKKQGGGKKRGKWNVRGGKGSPNIVKETSSPRTPHLQESSGLRTALQESPSHLSFLEPLTQCLVPSENKTLVWVGLHMVNRGFPTQFAIICLPSAADLAELHRDSNYGGPEEPVHKEFRLKQKRKLEKGQKMSRAKKAKLAQENRPEPPSTPKDFGYVSENKDETVGRVTESTKESSSSGSHIDSRSTKCADTVDSKHVCDKDDNDDVQMEVEASDGPFATTDNAETSTPTSKSSSTCLPPGHPELLKSCTRSIIGFVTNGAQSFSCGKGTGVGFCASLGLLNLLRDSPQGRKLVVLVRNVQSLQYRFAYIYVPSS